MWLRCHARPETYEVICLLLGLALSTVLEAPPVGVRIRDAIVDFNVL
jgi:hypothetical protein